ncbi:MAG: acyltransferase [Robiginitomaculum sp.]|nr:acyltransferase [Robiginitomaculum sp.]
MLKAVTIKDGHANFFTPLRFIFAYMVLIGHSFVVIGGTDTSEPHIFFHFTFSYLAVNLFFIASGFLVTGSMLYRKDAASFVSARILRIYPGLIAHVILMIVVFGAMTTSLPLWEYFTHTDTLKQPFIVLPFLESSMHLPGILENNSEHQASAALWTLRYELLAYVGTLVAFFLGLLKHRWMLFAQFAVFAIAFPLTHVLGIYDDLPATIQSLLRFGVCYGLGAAIYGYRDKIKLHLALIPILFGFSALIHNSVMFEISVMISLGYMLFWMAYVNIPKLNFLQKMNDVSYGLYIYHWAVIQGIFHFLPDVNVWQLIAIGSPIAVSLAYLSWIFVEKPALALKPKFTNMLKRQKTPPLNV